MKNSTTLADFPDNARIWIYGFPHDLSETDHTIIEKRLTDFKSEWMSHNEKVTGGYTLIYDRFIILCGECISGISGCSIDSSVRVFKELKDIHQLDGLNYDLVYFRDEEGIRAVKRMEFQELIDTGRVDSGTVVFNNTIQTLSELRNGMWETAMADSWHAHAFVNL